jgi:bifunctional UDP-N-acetylglucosamine pyrophosphorylase/glucosamine-1-phosphate N-acetyltransferase/UDP-N-acetylglucosamine pyrophosphorylase
MKSDLPKVLVPVCGRAMIQYVLDALAKAGVTRTVVVVGYRADLVRGELADREGVEFADQVEQLGTGHAVMTCREALADHDGPVCVVAGDSPMMRAESLRALLDEFDRSRPACLMGTAHKDDPSGLGRVIRDAAGEFVAIVEEKDATDAQREITEVNLSCYVFNNEDLFFALDRLTSDNAQREYYITDCPDILKRNGRVVRALAVLGPTEALSINTMDELAVVERAMQDGAA